MSKKSKKSETPSTPGRPQFTLKYPQSAFTVAELFAKNSVANGGSVKSALCIRQHISRGIFAKTIVQLDRRATSGTAGRPKLVYALESVATRNKWPVAIDGKLTAADLPAKAKKVKAPKAKTTTKRVRKAKVVVPAETPVVVETPVVENSVLPTELPTTPVVETTTPVETPAAN